MQKKDPLIKRLVAVLVLIFVVASILQIINSMRQDALNLRFVVEEPLKWNTFDSNIKTFSIQHPNGWLTADRPEGLGNDKEIIASITTTHPNYPFVQVAHRTLQADTLDAIAIWGESRIGAPQRKLTVSDYKTTSLIEMNINGKNALHRKYHYLDYWSQQINCHHVYLLDGKDAYAVEMCVNKKNDSPELQAVWEHMINSISF